MSLFIRLLIVIVTVTTRSTRCPSENGEDANAGLLALASGPEPMPLLAYDNVAFHDCTHAVISEPALSPGLNSHSCQRIGCGLLKQFLLWLCQLPALSPKYARFIGFSSCFISVAISVDSPAMRLRLSSTCEMIMLFASLSSKSPEALSRRFCLDP